MKILTDYLPIKLILKKTKSNSTYIADKKIPTDLKILNTVYSLYLGEFTQYSDDNKTRETKIYVPIDCMVIAKELNSDYELIFGRLYLYLNKKYSHEKAPFFEITINNDRHAIHFPLMVSVLADLRNEHRRFQLSIALSKIAIIISIVAIIFSA